MECDYVFKIILIGNTGVGKTCFLEKLVDNRYNYRHDPTIGVDFRMVYHKTDDDKAIKCHIWDTAGQEQFQSITRSYYKGAGGIIFMYDTSNMKSFKDIKKWYEIVKEERGVDNLPILLVGTKIDKIKKEVSFEAGERFAKEYNMDFYEISTKTDENVEKIIPGIANKIKSEIVDKEIDNIGVKHLDYNSGILKPYKKKGDEPNHWYSCCLVS
uniref:Uncharacterized protein n=1 Tax=viral metagenome TaxID=1070528 RepID=A0A6C0CRY4_9ZZZZ